MSNMMRYILLNQEKGKELMVNQQEYLDDINDKGYPPYYKEIDKDKEYQQHCEKLLDSKPF